MTGVPPTPVMPKDTTTAGVIQTLSFEPSWRTIASRDNVTTCHRRMGVTEFKDSQLQTLIMAEGC